MSVDQRRETRHQCAFHDAVRAYKGLWDRRRLEQRLTVARVAKAAGLSRQVISRAANDDWQRLKEAVEAGEPLYPEFGLLDDRERVLSADQRAVDALRTRVDACEARVKHLTSLSNIAIPNLQGEAQRLLARLAEHPRKETELYSTRADLAQARSEVESLKARVNWQSDRSLPSYNKTPYHTIPFGCVRTDLTASHLEEFYNGSLDPLGDILKTASLVTPLQAVYLLCGNHASGKYTWVSAHRPHAGGLYIYVIAPYHTRDSRRSVIAYIRSYRIDCRIVCVRIFANLFDCLERNGTRERQREQKMVSGDLIRYIDANFQEVTIDEGFDAIECVGDVGLAVARSVADGADQSEELDLDMEDEWGFGHLKEVGG